MSRGSLWVRRSRARGGLLAATAMTVLVVTFLMISIVGLAVRSERPAVRQTIAAGPVQAVGLSAETARSNSPRAQDAAARHVIAASLHGVDVDVSQTVSTAPLALDPKEAKRAGASSVVVMEDAPDLRENIRVTDGTWPSHPSGSVYPVAVQSDAATLLGLTIGDTLQIPSSSGALHLKVAATWRPRAPSAALWFGDQQVVTGRTGDALGPVIMPPAALERLDATPTVRWVVAPRADMLTPGQLPALASGFAHLGAALSANDDVSSTIVTIAGDGTRTTRGMQQSVASLGAVVSLPVALLAVGVVLALILLARLLSETRAAETTLLRARGATSASLMRVTAVESAAVGVVGAAVGGAAAIALIAIVTGGLPSALVFVVPAVLIALCVVVVHLGVVGAELRGALGVVRESGRARSVASLGLTVLVVIAAAFSVWRFLQYSDGGGSIDIAAVAAPALAILAAVMLGLSVFGPIARVLDRAGARSVGVAVTLPARQVGRGLGFFVAPVALLILAVGGTTLSAGYVGTWSGLSASASHVVNAGDLRVRTGDASPIRSAKDNASPSAFTAIDGVTAAIPAVTTSASLGAATVPVVAAPVDQLGDVLAPDGPLLQTAGIRSALGTAHSGAAGDGIALPLTATQLTLSLAASSSGDPATARSASATVWVTDTDGATAPLEFPATALAATAASHSGSATATAILPPTSGHWNIVAVDATVRGGMPGDDFRWKIQSLTAAVGGSEHRVDIAGVTGWHVASAAFPSERTIVPLSSGIGFTSSILDATSGVTVRLMPGAAHRPPVAVTSELAAHHGLSVGDTISLDGVWWATDATVADIIPVVPGEQSGAVLFDLPTLQDQLLRTGAAPPGINDVWIAASDPAHIRPRVQERAGSSASVTVADTAFVDRFFGSAIVGLWLGCLGCVALAVIALGAATAALSRRRRLEVSVFRALGFSGAQQRRSRSGELWVVGGVAAIIGLAAGVLVTALVTVALARLTVVTAPAALPVALVIDVPTIVVGLAVLAAAVIGVIFAYGAAIARQAADSEYREETR